MVLFNVSIGEAAGIWTQDRIRPRHVSWTMLDDGPIPCLPLNYGYVEIIESLIKLKASGFVDGTILHIRSKLNLKISISLYQFHKNFDAKFQMRIMTML